MRELQKKLGLANEIIGISRRQSTIEIAHAKEIIDKSSDSLATLAGNFGEDDLLVLAVPTLAIKVFYQNVRNMCLLLSQ